MRSYSNNTMVRPLFNISFPWNRNRFLIIPENNGYQYIFAGKMSRVFWDQVKVARHQSQDNPQFLFSGDLRASANDNHTLFQPFLLKILASMKLFHFPLKYIFL